MNEEMPNDRYLRNTRLYLVSAGLVSAALLGCSKGSSIKTVAVTGKVTYKGAPVEGASVTFWNTDPDGKPANGVTDAQGRYTLNTYVSPTDRPDGAIPGNYQVTVEKKPASANPDPSAAGMSQEERQRAYMAQQQKQAMASAVTESTLEDAPDAAPQSELPARYAQKETSEFMATVKVGDTAPKDFDLVD